ncbi:CopY/TcrY family copper transport repressor [Ignatzschineria sp. LJL83]
MKKIEITPSEWEVMRVLWANGDLGSSEIVKVLQKKRDWKPTTTKTLLSRLVAKEYVEAKSSGNKYIYCPTIFESEAWNSTANDLFGFICAKDRAKKLAGLITARELSREDIAILEASIERAKLDCVDDIPCDCFKGQCICHIQK